MTRPRTALAIAFVALMLLLLVLAIREGGGDTKECLKGRVANAACR
jgi:hypothetical protein